ncbi:response regulator transcription factor [Aestuariivita sp.]|uniref:response regulator n=1 Tax=Aestuariivita sp. TaxID=1872407 RepID=UPI00217266D5|nr:response regulator transcription factor [Aestuariivita sp.]MCE8006858.1 response regulator transcription factor [Aestuariivita sp.]
MTTRKQRILLVEDDAPIAELVAASLERAGFTVRIAGDVDSARTLMVRDRPNLVVLDLMLPGESGLDFAQTLTGDPLRPPIIMLTALGELSDRLAGFSAGADDYLSKPFSSEELIARIHAVLRRVSSSAPVAPDMLLMFEGWAMDLRRRTLNDPDDVEIVLTSAEFDVLATLCVSAGKVLSRDEIVMQSQGRRVEPYDRSVDTLISRLRQKIEGDAVKPTMIRTVRNGGYVFTPRVSKVEK